MQVSKAGARAGSLYLRQRDLSTITKNASLYQRKFVKIDLYLQTDSPRQICCISIGAQSIVHFTAQTQVP